MKNNKSLENSKLGLFVVAGLVFLVFSLYMIGRNQSLFGSTFAVTAEFNNVNGLVPGNDVRFSGIEVGTVDRIDLISDTTALVRMLIQTKYKDYIHQNAIATVGTDGLMGNKLINIKSASGTSPLVGEGSKIQTRKPVETDEMLQTLNTTNKNVAIITANLKEITIKLNQSNSLWSILSDTVMAADLKKVVKDIRAASINTSGLTRDAAEMVRKFKNGRGPAMALFTDTVMTQKLQKSLNEIELASKNLNDASRDLSATMRKVEKGQSPAGVVLADSVSAEHMRQTLINIQLGTAKFNENMEAMKHNWLFKGYFKDQEKKKAGKK